MHPQLHLRILVATLVLATRLAAQQPADFEWLDAVRSPKDQHTLALLRIGAEGFHLLRWQEEQRDYTGKVTPAHPVLARLNPAGELLASAPVPGLEPDSGFVFQLAVSNDSLVLFGYEKRFSNNIHVLFIRVFDLIKNAWAGPESDLFYANTSFDKAWFSRSPDGSHTGLYFSENSSLHYAILDDGFRVLHNSSTIWPATSGNQLTILDIFCSNQGELLFYAQSAKKDGNFTIYPPERPAVYHSNGSAAPISIRAPESKGALFNVVLLLKTGLSENKFYVFYPNNGKKYTGSSVFAQVDNGLVTFSGLASDIGADAAESYFIYQINTNTSTAAMLQNTVLPSAVHRAFQSDKDVAAKTPIPSLRLRWLNASADGRNWLLVEKVNALRSPVEFDEAALLRLDSTWKITAARRIEKYQQATPGDVRFFGSVATCPAPKGWWVLWNKGAYPSASLMLTDCKSAGEPLPYELLSGARLVLALLPHTQYGYDGKWYFAGESANGDRFGVGVLKRTGKK